VRGGPAWARYVVTINQNFSPPAKYATLVHELAHLYCGHLGGDHEGEWESRTGATYEEMEFEAESVSFMVCRRAKRRRCSDAAVRCYNSRQPFCPICC
jgi:hypothetical protein